MFNFHQQKFSAACGESQDRTLAIDKLAGEMEIMRVYAKQAATLAEQNIEALKKQLIEKNKELKSARQNVKRRKKQLKIK